MKVPDHEQFSFRALEVFIAVVESRSVTIAAKRLGCSASTVSSQLAKLEDAMGAKLVLRTAQRFELTIAGNMFLTRAQTILDEIQAAKADFSDHGHTTNMHLRIAVIEEFDRAILPIWLAKVRDDYPHCTFEIRSGTSHESHAALFSRGVDIIVAADNTTFIEGIDEIQILHDPYIYVAPADSSHARSKTMPTDRPFIRYSAEQLLSQQIEAQLRRTRLRPPPSFECSSTQAVFSLVKAFDGWALTTAAAALGAFLEGDIAISKFSFGPVPLQQFSRTISLYCRTGSLGEMPEKIADNLKSTLRDNYLPRAKQVLPFLETHIVIAL